MRLLQRGGRRVTVYPAGRRAKSRQRQCGTDQLLPHFRRTADLRWSFCVTWLRRWWQFYFPPVFGSPSGGPAVLAPIGRVLGRHVVPAGPHVPLYVPVPGGKGILSGGTIAIMIDWRIALVVWGGFLILVLLTRYISLGSCWAGASFPFATWFVYRDPVLTGVRRLSGLPDSVYAPGKYPPPAHRDGEQIFPAQKRSPPGARRSGGGGRRRESQPRRGGGRHP